MKLSSSVNAQVLVSSYRNIKYIYIRFIVITSIISRAAVGKA